MGRERNPPSAGSHPLSLPSATDTSCFFFLPSQSPLYSTHPLHPPYPVHGELPHTTTPVWPNQTPCEAGGAPSHQRARAHSLFRPHERRKRGRKKKHPITRLAFLVGQDPSEFYLLIVASVTYSHPAFHLIVHILAQLPNFLHGTSRSSILQCCRRGLPTAFGFFFTHFPHSSSSTLHDIHLHFQAVRPAADSDTPLTDNDTSPHWIGLLLTPANLQGSHQT